LWYDGYHGKKGSDLVACGRMAGRVYILDQCEVFSHQGVADSPRR
jgi:hypothetical protein